MGISYRTVRADGSTAVIINKGRVLLLRRVRIPFILNPGIWYFISGGRKGDESPVETAYREAMEETKLERGKLKVLYKGSATFADPKKMISWRNSFFVFSSTTDKIKINIEHSAFRWVTFPMLLREGQTLSAVYDRKKVLGVIRKFMPKATAKSERP